MQIPPSKSHVFKLCNYSKKHSNKNNQNRQDSDLASTQKYKKPAEIIRVHGILSKYDPKICKIDIVNDGFIAKKNILPRIKHWQYTIYQKKQNCKRMYQTKQ